VRYGVGTRLRVQVSRVDLDGRKIDFRLVQDDAGDARALKAPAAKAERGSGGGKRDAAGGKSVRNAEKKQLKDKPPRDKHGRHATRRKR